MIPCKHNHYLLSESGSQISCYFSIFTFRLKNKNYILTIFYINANITTKFSDEKCTRFNKIFKFYFSYLRKWKINHFINECIEERNKIFNKKI